MILNDYRCNECGRVTESLEPSGTYTIQCPTCLNQAHLTITKTNLSSDVDSFNPHYDLQLGEHFQTASEKKRFLERTGRKQESGSLSPKKSGSGRYICTKSQAKGFDKPMRGDELRNVDNNRHKPTVGG